tara:strand:+ start:433 stop:732 length:300 start_codon:yes stop_codon:yes gene_type:complete
VSTKKYVYKVHATNTGVGIYFESLEDVFEYIKVTAKGIISNPDDFYISINCKDYRWVAWDALDYKVQAHYTYKMQNWIDAGMPSSVPVESDSSEEELAK